MVVVGRGLLVTANFPISISGGGGNQGEGVGDKWNAWCLVLPPSMHLGELTNFDKKFCNFL